MRLKTYLSLLSILLFQLVSCAEESLTPNIAPTPAVTESPAPVQEASIQKNTLETQKNVFFSDIVSEYDATLNDFNINSLIFAKNSPFTDGKDQFGEDIPEMKPFLEAMERFSQSNVSAAYKGFKTAIDEGPNNDYYYMMMAYKLADIGLFSLADESTRKIQNLDIWQSYIDELRKYYFPKNHLNNENELFLANAFTDITYNNMTRESVSAIIEKGRLTKRSDYANYIIANGLFAENDTPKALIAINKAISINSDNISYLKLKTRILCEQKNYEGAMITVKSMRSKHILYPETVNETNKLQFFVLSQTEKNPIKAKYYLAYYFYLNNDNAKALKELNTICPKNKMPEAYNLVGDINLAEKDYDKAYENYEKNTKIFKHYAPSYKGMANINIVKKDYSEAIKNYSKAYKYNKKDSDTIINLSIVNFKNKDLKQSKDYCLKAFKINPDNYKAFYIYSKLRPEKTVFSLKKAQQANPFYPNTLLDLADISLLNKDRISAKSYINSVKFLEENNYRYYYYSGLLDRMDNNSENADKNFKKAADIYSTINSQKTENKE